MRDEIRKAVEEADDEKYILTDKQLDAIVNIVNAEKVKTMQSWEALGTLYTKRGKQS